ncbi:MAG: J domain-containing protein [Cyanobacteria bacterium P01_C01_bin.73]
MGQLVDKYYTLLGLKPGASVQAIRRAYWELSKRYHPDTTTLPAAIATERFQQLNEAYATLSNPERRLAYDLKIGYSPIAVMQPRPGLNQPGSTHPSSGGNQRSSSYLDPTDRPLSPGELFALFILGVTFVACLLLVITVSIIHGEVAARPLVPPDLAAHTSSITESITGIAPNAPQSQILVEPFGISESDL